MHFVWFITVPAHYYFRTKQNVVFYRVEKGHHVNNNKVVAPKLIEDVDIQVVKE